MEKTITVKRDYKYLVFLLIFGVLIIFLTESYFIHYDSITMEVFAKENNLYKPFSQSNYTQMHMYRSEIADDYFVIRSFIMLALIPLYIFWYKETKNDFIKIVLLLFTIITIPIVITIGTNDFDFGTEFMDRYRWQVRILYLSMTLPFILIFYSRVIIGDTILERVHKKKEIEKGFSTYQEKLNYALENNIVTKEEYDQKISEHRKKFMEKVVLTDREYISYKQKLDSVLTDNIISKEEHETKLKDFREKRLEEINKKTD